MNTMKRTLLKFVLMATIVCASPGYCEKTKIHATESNGWHQSSMQLDNQIRHFRYFVPTHSEQPRLPKSESNNATTELADANRMPMVVLLHGGTQSMSKLFRKHSGASQSWSGLAQQEHFVLMVPNGTNIKTQDTAGDDQHWNDCRPFIQGTGAGSKSDDVRFILRLMDWASENVGVDPQRIYVTGASNGGMMSYRLAQETAHKIAAMTVFVANLPEPSECQENSVPMPMMIVNGTEDTLVPWAGGSVTGGAGQVMSSEKTVAYWLQVNGLKDVEPTVFDLPDSSSRDKSHVVKNTYSSSMGFPLEYYVVKGGGHTIPSPHHEVPGWLQGLLLGRQNKDFDAVFAAWQFMKPFRSKPNNDSNSVSKVSSGTKL